MASLPRRSECRAATAYRRPPDAPRMPARRRDRIADPSLWGGLRRFYLLIAPLKVTQSGAASRRCYERRLCLPGSGF